MFDSFQKRRIKTDDAEIHLRYGGSGPPLLLLHGYPQTHMAWHEVAPGLAEEFSVVAADLRGYGDSVGPASPKTDDYSNRSMARDMVAVMEALGHNRFALAGHDRGGRVAYRLALDHPDTVTQLAVLDMIPNVEKVERFTVEMAKAAYHWFFLAQPHPIPERLVGNDPDFFIDTILQRWTGDDVFAPDAVSEYRRCFRTEEVVRAICEDYRAGLSIDLVHDRADREAGQRIDCPVLSLWGEANKSDLATVWERWAEDVTAAGIDCGHFLMEEAPRQTRDHLERFFA